MAADLAKVVATTKTKVASLISMARTKTINKTKKKAAGTAEVHHVKVWDPKWDNINKKHTKITTTMLLSVRLTQNGVKLRMRWSLSSSKRQRKTSR